MPLSFTSYCWRGRLDEEAQIRLLSMSDAHDTAPSSGRVVVVEDDPLQAESLAFILRQEGYVVELAATGAEALVIARSQPAPDTVLLDVALPDLSGVEVA